MRLMRFGPKRLIGLAALAFCATGCSTGNDTPAVPLPSLPSLESVAALATPVAAPKGSATELYTKVARGAVGCWFGANGPLKSGHIYHAEADAPSRGGKAEITIHQRDSTNANPRGPKAYLIKFEPKDEDNASIVTENLKMSDAHAKAMAADVERWSRGVAGCAGQSTAAGWAPAEAAPPAVLSKAAAKPAKKKPVPASKTATP